MNPLMQTDFTYLTIHNIKVNRSTPDQALRELETLLHADKRSYVCFFEANLFYCTIIHKELQEIINRASLIYPDGISVSKSAFYNSGLKFERISGPSFLLKVCEYGVSKHWKHFFLGGAEGVAEKLATSLKDTYPGIDIVGYYSPPFRKLTEEDNLYIKNLVEQCNPDFLWVGLGGPKQELWMHENLNKINVPIMLGIGAAFDFHSGNKPWAPAIIRKIGLEWLWRIFSGGKRTCIRNIKCISVI